MKILKVTWWRVTKIWWGIIWRYIIYSLLLYLPVTFLMGIIITAPVISDEAKLYVYIAGSSIGLPISIWIIKIVLEKQFSDFRIIFASTEDLISDEKDNNT